MIPLESVIDRILKVEILNKIFTIIFNLSAFLYLLAFLLIYSMNKSSTISTGFNKIYLTIPLFLLAIWYQRYLFNKFYNSEGKDDLPRQKLTKLSIALALLYIPIGAVYTYFFMPGEQGDIHFEFSIMNIIKEVFKAICAVFIISGMIFALLFYFFKLGVLLGGANICIGLHNYFNGFSFNIAPIYKNMLLTFCDIALPDLLGVIITLIQIIVAISFGKIGELFS